MINVYVSGAGDLVVVREKQWHHTFFESQPLRFLFFLAVLPQENSEEHFKRKKKKAGGGAPRRRYSPLPFLSNSLSLYREREREHL